MFSCEQTQSCSRSICVSLRINKHLECMSFLIKWRQSTVFEYFETCLDDIGWNSSSLSQFAGACATKGFHTTTLQYMFGLVSTDSRRDVCHVTHLLIQPSRLNIDPQLHAWSKTPQCTSKNQHKAVCMCVHLMTSFTDRSQQDENEK